MIKLNRLTGVAFFGVRDVCYRERFPAGVPSPNSGGARLRRRVHSKQPAGTTTAPLPQGARPQRICAAEPRTALRPVDSHLRHQVPVGDRYDPSESKIPAQPCGVDGTGSDLGRASARDIRSGADGLSAAAVAAEPYRWGDAPLVAAPAHAGTTNAYAPFINQASDAITLPSCRESA